MVLLHQYNICLIIITILPIALQGFTTRRNCRSPSTTNLASSTVNPDIAFPTSSTSSSSSSASSKKIYVPTGITPSLSSNAKIIAKKTAGQNFGKSKFRTSKNQEFSVQFLRKHSKKLLQKKTLKKKNHHTFHWLLDGWAQCQDVNATDAPLQAERLLEKMIAMNVAPNIRTYTKLLTCYARYAGSYPNAVERAVQIVKDLVDDLENDDDNKGKGAGVEFSKKKPTTLYLYTAAIRTCVNADAPHVAHDLLKDLLGMIECDDAIIVSNAASVSSLQKCYNQVLQAYANTGSVSDAERLFEQMEESSMLEPDTRSYNALLKAWSKSGATDAFQRAENILKRMQSDLYAHAQPDVYSFSTVIHALARSAVIGKEEKACQILRDMQGDNVNTKPNVVIYNAVLNACAFSSGNEVQQQRAMELAHRTFQELLNNPLVAPDDITYSTFFQACHNLLPTDTPTRDAVLDALFRKCCAEGLIGETVLRLMYISASTELCDRLLGNYNVDDSKFVHIQDVPMEWRRNVLLSSERRRNT